jgi:pilus assembly protein Flp/PilA
MNLNFTKKKSDLVNCFSSERGITAIEYALLAALIAVAIIGGATLLGTTLDGFFSAVADKIDTYKP